MEPRDQIVVRGGSVRDAHVLIEQIMDNAAMGQSALSVFADRAKPGESDDDCFVRLCHDLGLPHGKVQRSTRCRIERAGLAMVHEPGQNQGQLHYHVHFSDPVTESEAVAFVAAFDPPTPNPAKGR